MMMTGKEFIRNVLSRRRGPRGLVAPRARSGVSAMLVGLSLVPIMGMLAVGMDYSAALDLKANVDAAADSALVQTLNAAMTDYLNSQNPDSTTQGTPDFTDAIAAGVQRFRSQAGAYVGSGNAAPTISVAVQGQTLQASLTYATAYPTVLSQMFGFASIPIGINPTATAALPSYVDMQVLMDNSGSMEIGGTLNDIQNLFMVTNPGSNFASPAGSWWTSGCAFACHWDPNNNDFFNASRLNNITLRWDQLKSTLNSMISTVQSADGGGHYRLGLYTFNTDLTVNYGLTNDLSGAQSALSSVQVPLSDPNAAYDTNLTESLESFAANYLNAPGDGALPTAPKKFVFILTDGVEDVYSPGRPSDRLESAFDPTVCQTMKAQGVTVGVIHTLYLDPPGPGYDSGEFAEISSIQDSVSAALESCASAGMYFAVSDQTSLNAAMQHLLSAAIGQPVVFTK